MTVGDISQSFCERFLRSFESKDTNISIRYNIPIIKALNILHNEVAQNKIFILL